MKVLITKRVNGDLRVGEAKETHWATGLPYGDEEIVDEKEFDIPDACYNDYGIVWNGQNILFHPDIVAWSDSIN